jgi:hypothetical protein
VGPWEENERKIAYSLPKIKENTDFQIVVKDIFVKMNIFNSISK